MNLINFSSLCMHILLYLLAFFSLYFPLVVCVYSPLNYPSSSLALLPCTYTYTLRFSHTVLHSSLWMCGGKKAFVFKDNYFFFFCWLLHRSAGALQWSESGLGLQSVFMGQRGSFGHCSPIPKTCSVKGTFNSITSMFPSASLLLTSS